MEAVYWTLVLVACCQYIRAEPGFRPDPEGSCGGSQVTGTEAIQKIGAQEQPPVFNMRVQSRGDAWVVGFCLRYQK
jgi:hypothetical protein